MKTKHVIRGFFARNFYNGSEALAKVLIYRKPPKDITVENHIRFGEARHERYNFIYGNNRSVKQPLMIYVHGGGWISGDADLRNTYCVEFAKRGFFVANINYGYSPQTIFPGQIQHCLTAIEQIYALCDKYNFDTSRILLAGESAGGHLIAYLAALGLNKTLYDKLGLHFKYKDGFAARALISNCGAIDISALTESKFPDMKFMISCCTGMSVKELTDKNNREKTALFTTPIEKGFPPTMLIYARHDQLRFESFKIRDKFDKLGVVYREYECTGIISMHAWALAVCLKKGRECLDATLDFILPYFNDDEAEI